MMGGQKRKEIMAPEMSEKIILIFFFRGKIRCKIFIC